MIEEAKQIQHYRHYPFWDNVRYTMVQMREKEGVVFFAVIGANVFLSVVQPFLGMALPGAVVYLLGSAMPPGVIFLALAAYVLTLQGLEVLSEYIGGISSKKRFSFRLRFGSEIFEACMDADFQEFESDMGQEKLQGARRNIYSGNQEGMEAYVHGFERALTALLGLAVYSAVMGMRNPWILLLLAGMSGISVAVRFHADKCSRKYDKLYLEDWKDFGYLCRESLAGGNGKDIRMYHMWKWFSAEFGRLKDKLAHWSGKNRNCVTNAEIADHFLALVRDLLVYAYLIGQMAQGKLALGAFLLYVGIVAGFGRRMVSLMEAVNAVLYNGRHLDRYRDFVEFSKRNYGGEEMPLRSGQEHEIRLEHVSFRYEESGEDVIRDVSLTIAPGEKIALVGMNGAGKSTLIKLICGLYRPTSGRIYLDGKDIGGLSPKEYRKELAVVFQDVFAFSFSLGDNVSCREEKTTDRERLRASLEDAGLWERVQAFDGKEGTFLNKDMDAGGVSLSGGELQRLMLARALYKDAQVVILDEPTAALDPIAESEMYEKYDELTKGKTSIFISHRLSSTRFCHRILFLEDGRITEEGSHEQLMARQGSYAGMFQTQAQYYRDEDKTL